MSGDVRCFRCGRPLSNHVSVQAGIGPICRAKRETDLDAEEMQRQKNLECHYGFTCYNPQHSGTTLARFLRRFNAMADQTGVQGSIRAEVVAQCEHFADALGLNRDEVSVPSIDVPMFGRETIAALNIPLKNQPGVGSVYSMPVDHDEQYCHIQLRAMGVCPYGLDCRDPRQAVGAVWSLLSLMRYQVEPLLLTDERCGWSWDRLLYQYLANTLQVLGLHDDAQDIEDIVQEQAEKPNLLRIWQLAES